MKSVLIDTNVLVSFVTDRNAEQQARAAALFGLASEGEVQALVPSVVLTELVYVLLNVYRTPATDVRQLLSDLLEFPGVEVVEERSWASLLELWPSKIPSVGDAVVATAALAARADAVATFDTAFGRKLGSLGLRSYWRSGKK